MDWKAARSLVFVIQCIYFTSTFLEAKQNQTYVYALPNAPLGNESVSCPTSECYTLQELSETYKFKKSHTTLVLLPGRHKIIRSTSLNIENIHNFAIVGSLGKNLGWIQGGSPVIWCLSSEPFLINIRNVTGLLVRGFTMFFCAGIDTAFNTTLEAANGLSYFSQYSVSIKIASSSNILLDNVSVFFSSGLGLWLLQVHSNVYITNSEFSHNKDNCLLESFENDKFSGSRDTYIYAVIANSVFSFGKGDMYVLGGLYVQINMPTLRFEIHLQNVTMQNNELTAGNAGFQLYSSMTSLLNISKLNSYNTLHKPEKVISILSDDRFNKEWCHFSGLDLKLAGSMDVLIQDSNFTGPGSCVEVSTAGPGRGQHVYFYKTKFRDAKCHCGALSFQRVPYVTMCDILITNSSESSFVIFDSNVTFNGTSSIEGNNDGLGLYQNSALFIDSNSLINFENNSCLTNNIHCTILEVESSNIILFANSTLMFKNNSGTAILVLHHSTMEIVSNISMMFDGNSGINGGALSLYARSTVTICSGNYFSHYRYLVSVVLCDYRNMSIFFINNHASSKGGAIFIDDSSYFSPFLGVAQSNLNAFGIFTSKINFYFINNTADNAGSAIYGGWIVYEPNIGEKVFNFDSGGHDISIVSSNPVRVCICALSVPNCTIINHQVYTYPGRTVKINAVAVGQKYGTVSSIVHAKLMSTDVNNLNIALKEGQYIQEVYKHCTKLAYTIYSLNHIEELLLTVERRNTPNLDRLQLRLQTDLSMFDEIDILKQELSVVVKFKDCPIGFSFDYPSKICSCHWLLREYQINNCSIETLKIAKPSQKWINATYIHTLANDTGVIVNNHCPFDYCKQNSTHILLNLEHPDDQCDFNRSGILCGSCQTNFSHVLGTSKCKKCSSLWTILLIPVVAIVGVLLIVAMLVLNLTVSTGMLNGLILFANIVRANHSSFFNSNTFLSYFIAWLNLDLGFEMYFYNGLDAYVKTWLQFIFPLYIWTIMIILIALSRRYVFVVRLCGSNVVQVLATLFLLSYAKLIRTIITIFQFTTLVYPDGYKRRVWLYDGNVDYLKGKHIPLFITGLILLLFLSIPYTVSLVFIQWLRKYNHHRLLRWVGKLKPLFDAYTGPFKEKHCYWFGVLLLVRVALYLVFSLNVSGDTSLNLMAIGTTTVCIFSYLVVVGGVYESLIANITDVSFMLNLSILTMGAHFYNNPQSVSTISVSIAFCQFILITLYHLYLRITETRKGRQWNEMLKTKLKQIFTSQRVVSVREYFAPPVRAHREDISHHSIELKESLLVDITDAQK